VNGTSARRVSSPLLAVLLGLLLAGVAACTDGRAPDKPRASPSPTTTSAPARPSAPMRVQVTHVAGQLSAPRRRALAAAVGRTVSAYLDAAFLAGDYPRSSFSSAFTSFTPGAARLGRADRALLTNQPLGPTTRSVRATRRAAYLSVLAPRGRVAGATAAVDVGLTVDRAPAATQRIHLTGRLLLSKDPRGRWRIFGYDLDRSQTRAGRSR